MRPTVGSSTRDMRIWLRTSREKSDRPCLIIWIESQRRSNPDPVLFLGQRQFGDFSYPEGFQLIEEFSLLSDNQNDHAVRVDGFLPDRQNPGRVDFPDPREVGTEVIIGVAVEL